ncbi:MAG: hypothetical protein ACM3WV_00605 [Bacillota bacterium]
MKILLILFMAGLFLVCTASTALAAFIIYADYSISTAVDGSSTYDTALMVSGFQYAGEGWEFGLEYGFGEYAEYPEWTLAVMDLYGGPKIATGKILGLYLTCSCTGVVDNEVSGASYTKQTAYGAVIGANLVAHFNPQVSLEGSLGFSAYGNLVTDSSSTGKSEEDVDITVTRARLTLMMSEGFGGLLGYRSYTLIAAGSATVYSGLTVGFTYEF